MPDISSPINSVGSSNDDDCFWRQHIGTWRDRDTDGGGGGGGGEDDLDSDRVSWDASTAIFRLVTAKKTCFVYHCRWCNVTWLPAPVLVGIGSDSRLADKGFPAMIG